MHNLIGFEATKLNFTAKFPACWTPISSEQHQQRKHPQHLLSEPINFTKSWKFTSSSTNSLHDDVLIEIYLNKAIHIGCMQIKIKFNKELNIPYELRLFRQRKTSEPMAQANSNVDSKIDFK